jgi:hypothetical protein
MESDELPETTVAAAPRWREILIARGALVPAADVRPRQIDAPTLRLDAAGRASARRHMAAGEIRGFWKAER